jgi:hypothetical protein
MMDNLQKCILLFILIHSASNYSGAGIGCGANHRKYRIWACSELLRRPRDHFVSVPVLDGKPRAVSSSHNPTGLDLKGL